VSLLAKRIENMVPNTHHEHVSSDATTAVNIFTDWVTAFMPIPLLWNIQLNRNTKISVVCVLGLGFFASISACVRLKYTVNLTAQENYLCTSPFKWLLHCTNILTVSSPRQMPLPIL
jgi:hypothetical protein